MAIQKSKTDVAGTVADPLIQVRNLQKQFEIGQESLIPFRGEQKLLNAVDGVSFDLARGEIVGLAGQSGCGKSTLGELLVRLQSPTAGEIRYNGEDVTAYDKAELKRYRQSAQVIFQDPYEALNPRFTVAQTVSEPLKIHDMENIDERTKQALVDAGLEPPEDFLGKFPSELSGGERQRVCIAKAIVLDPDFIVADEPVSMLDVSVSTQILKLFKKLQREREITILYISHDLSTINSLTDRTMIMYLGDIVEIGETEDVIHEPSHPYTKDLLSAVPGQDIYEEGSITETIPDPTDLPSGCRYIESCAYAREKCEKIEPELEPVDESKVVACHYPVSE